MHETWLWHASPAITEVAGAGISVDGGAGDKHTAPWTPIHPILLESDFHSHLFHHMQSIVASDICLKPETQFVTSFNDSTMTLRDSCIPRRMSALIFWKNFCVPWSDEIHLLWRRGNAHRWSSLRILSMAFMHLISKAMWHNKLSSRVAWSVLDSFWSMRLRSALMGEIKSRTTRVDVV
jgi:hypothetical protein